MTKFIGALFAGLALAGTAAVPAQAVDTDIRLSCIRW
jgi:hypothetical protein